MKRVRVLMAFALGCIALPHFATLYGAPNSSVAAAREYAGSGDIDMDGGGGGGGEGWGWGHGMAAPGWYSGRMCSTETDRAHSVYAAHGRIV